MPGRPSSSSSLATPGWCIFHDQAVAARAAQRDAGIGQVLFVDLDVHQVGGVCGTVPADCAPPVHCDRAAPAPALRPSSLPPAQGDGTASIFRHDPSVFTLSLHCAAQPFPHTPEAGDMDVALPAGTTDEQYLQASGPRLAGCLWAPRAGDVHAAAVPALENGCRAAGWRRPRTNQAAPPARPAATAAFSPRCAGAARGAAAAAGTAASPAGAVQRRCRLQPWQPWQPGRLLLAWRMRLQHRHMEGHLPPAGCLLRGPLLGGPATPAGVDVHAEDTLGKMALTDAGILARDRFVFEACALAGAPVAAAIGGGYCPDHERIVERHGGHGAVVVGRGTAWARDVHYDCEAHTARCNSLSCLAGATGQDCCSNVKAPVQVLAPPCLPGCLQCCCTVRRQSMPRRLQLLERLQHGLRDVLENCSLSDFDYCIPLRCTAILSSSLLCQSAPPLL